METNLHRHSSTLSGSKISGYVSLLKKCSFCVRSLSLIGPIVACRGVLRASPVAYQNDCQYFILPDRSRPVQAVCGDAEILAMVSLACAADLTVESSSDRIRVSYTRGFAHPVFRESTARLEVSGCVT